MIHKLAIALFVTFAAIAQAALPKLNTDTFIVDDEIESLLTDIVTDLLKAAGVKHLKPKIYLIHSNQVNAATAQGGCMLIYTSLIKECDKPEQLLGVLAHEVGHMVAGHISTLQVAEDKAMIPLLAATILGGAASIASGRADALIAGVMGGSQLAMRGLLRFTRTHESSADQAAVKLLQKLNWPTVGLSDFLQKLDRLMASKVADIDPYTLTHPLSKDRVRAVRSMAQGAPGAVPEKYSEGFYRIRAKIIGFLTPLREVKHFYPESDTSPYARYARAIAYYRAGRKHMGKAMTELDQLITMQPENPFLYELKGQILFENGQVKAALEPLVKAAQLRPGSAQIKTFLSHVMLETGETKYIKRATNHLLYATQHEPRNVMAWRLLATAFGRDKSLPQAERKAYIAWCLSETDYLTGHFGAAEKRLKHINDRIKLPYGIRQRIDDLKYLLAHSKKSPETQQIG